ncbi:cupin domain-containing protein [Pseudosporangium ferrugineum]|uniref:Cupin superfamily protein n=1 Tax=Pseudosporangium ferrugineum TaxID=439699 RepID=A0A2T0SJQ6_9ACTN|nr:cupin domain-containing protein [Pseudosporangium ferrugineum]PRY33644.1 Cupin superfamily protein [Pseudosporangium ferrugineum]
MTHPTPDGTDDRPALSRVIAADPAKFAEAYWGRQPLLTRADELAGPDGFLDLLSPDAVDELLSERGLRTPFLRVADRGTVLPAARFTGSGGAGAEIGDQVVDDKILQLYADGATLVLQGLHRLWPPLIRYAGRLGAELRRPLQVNAYLTPAGNKGFATHYDTHDVFVLQVDGTKRWRIHEPVLPEPLERQAWGGRADEVGAVAEGPAALDVVLAPGDALYLPRGWLHSAEAQGERSLHLTFGIRSLTRYALVEELLGLAAADQRLRATLPYGLDVADPAEVEPELAATVAALRDWLQTADPADVAERLRARSWPAARPAPVRPLAQLAYAENLTPDDRVAVRGGLRWDLRDDGPSHVVLRLSGRTLRFPSFCAAAVRAALDGRTHRVGDLPGLDDDADRLVLARRLLREAVLTPA